MSWDDWNDDEPRPRRRRRKFDVDDVRSDGPPQSGAVTTAGVMSIVMAVLFLLCGGCFGITGLFCTGMGMAARQGGAMIPPDVLENYGGVFLGWALLHLIMGVCLLIAGIITLQRRNWGRVFTLILAGIVALMGMTQLVVFIMVGASEGGGLFNANAEDRVGQSVVGSIGALLYLGYAVFVYIVLLNAHNKEEFD